MAHASPAPSNWTASSSSPMLGEKDDYKNTVYTPIPTSQGPFVAYDQSAEDLSTKRAQTRLVRVERLQRYNNIVCYVLAIASVSITLYMEATMAYVLVKYFTTKNISAPGRAGPWAKNTQLWPTFVMLAGSFLTFVLDIGGLIAALCHRMKTNRVEKSFNYIGYAVPVVKWIAVLILYRVGKTTKDLWGWSCGDVADEIQQFYTSKLDFQGMCLEQSIAWYLTFAEVGLKLLLLIVAFWLSHKVRKLVRVA